MRLAVQTIPDTFWDKSPYFAALMFLVITFGWYLERRDKQANAAQEKRDHELMEYVKLRDNEMVATIGNMGDDCHALQRSAVDALKENTKILGKVLGVLMVVERSCEDLHSKD